MRKVYLTLTVDAVVEVDDGVDLGDAIREAELTLVDNLNRFDMVQPTI